MAELHNNEQTQPENDLGSSKDAITGLQRLLSAPAATNVLSSLLFFNLFFLMTRPQDIVPVLGQTKIAVILSLILLTIVPAKFSSLWKRTVVVRVMCGLLLVGAIWVPLARNNFWAFHNFRDLAQQFFCYLFPIMILFFYGKRLKQLVTLFTFSGLFLGLWAATHSGRGPGGHLGDENDLCLALISFLGIPLVMITAKAGFGRKIFMALAIGAMFAGIVISSSRGGFVGLVGLIGYTYLQSPRKLAMTVVGVLVAVAGLLAVPQQYWNEMSTITDTKEDTADQRLETWTIIKNMWLDKPNFLFGVGMGNTPYRMGEYEGKENRTAHGRSLAGRAAHSTVMQLVGDLGLAGILIFLVIVTSCFWGNTKQLRRLKKMERYLKGRLSQTAGQKLDPALEEVRGAINYGLMHVLFLRSFLAGINASWIGTVGAGLFISTFYYPPMWVLAGVTVALQYHNKLFFDQMMLLEDFLPRNERK